MKNEDEIAIKSALRELLPPLQVLYDYKQEQIFQRFKDNEIDLKTAAKSNDFIQAFIIVWDKIVKTGIEEKVEFLISVFISNYKEDQFKDFSSYENSLNILAELSMPEINTLILLDKFETENRWRGPGNYKSTVDGSEMRCSNKLHWVRFWFDGFRNKLKKSIPEDKITGILHRLQASGLYYCTESCENGRGYLTANYYSLKSYIHLIIDLR